MPREKSNLNVFCYVPWNLQMIWMSSWFMIFAMPLLIECRIFKVKGLFKILIFFREFKLKYEHQFFYFFSFFLCLWICKYFIDLFQITEKELLREFSNFGIVSLLFFYFFLFCYHRANILCENSLNLDCLLHIWVCEMNYFGIINKLWS